MKETIAIFCQAKLVRTDVSAFIRQQGGRNVDDGNLVGTLQTTEGVVWIFFDEVETQRESTMEIRGDRILDLFGGPYGSSVVLEASSRDGSAALVTDLAIACCRAWAPAFANDWTDGLYSLEDIVRLRAEGRTFRDIGNEEMRRIGVDKML